MKRNIGASHLVLAGLFAACIFVGWWVQHSGQNQGQFVRDFQTTFEPIALRYGNIESLRTTVGTVFIEVQPGTGPVTKENIARTWVKNFSDFRKQKLGRPGGEVIILERSLEVFRAWTRNGIDVKVEDLSSENQ